MKMKTDNVTSTCFLHEEILKKELRKQLKIEIVGNQFFNPFKKKLNGDPQNMR